MSSLPSREIALTKMMLAIFVGFSACHGPYFLANVLDGELNKYPEWLHKLSAWLLYMHTCVNPVLYGVMNTQFRQEYERIFASIGDRCSNSKRRQRCDGRSTGQGGQRRNGAPVTWDGGTTFSQGTATRRFH